MAKFDIYAALLVDWQSRMNLVGPATLSDIWGRHFGDSAQLVALAGECRGTWLDIGSGAGFPAIVVALLGRSGVVAVEATAKKCRFLETVTGACGLGGAVTVRQMRIEALPPFSAGLISARACSALAQLFDWGLRFAAPATTWLLPKGQTVGDEIAAARAVYSFEAELVPSRSDPRGRIVVAHNVRRRR